MRYRWICVIAAFCMVLTMTACHAPSDETETSDASRGIVPLFYEQGGDLMLMDVISGKTRCLTAHADVWDTYARISEDHKTVHFLEKPSADAQTMSLYVIEGDVMTAQPKELLRDVAYFDTSFDGEVVIYIRENALYRLAENGTSEQIADQVEVFGFQAGTDTIVYSVLDDNVTGDNLFARKADGTVTPMDLSQVRWEYNGDVFEKDCEINDDADRLTVDGVVVDESYTAPAWAAETADQFAYFKDIVNVDAEGMSIPCGTLMLYNVNGQLVTVNEGIYEGWGGSVRGTLQFLSDGSLVYMLYAGGHVFSLHRYHDGVNTTLANDAMLVGDADYVRWNMVQKNRQRVNDMR